MAFPGDYTLYQNVTIDKTKVSGTNSNYPCLVDLSDMVKAGADIFDTCRTDGGDIRVTLPDGTTQIAREIVPESFDKSAKIGEMWVNIPTLTDADDYVVRIWYNGTDTEPASDSTYGSENAWNSNYKAVFHMAQDPSGSAPQMVDSTSNDNDGTAHGSLVTSDLVAGQIGDAIDFRTALNEYIESDDHASLDITGELTLQAWIYKDSNLPENRGIVSKHIGSGDERSYTLYGVDANDALGFAVSSTGTSGTIVSVDGTTPIDDSAWHKVSGVFIPSTSLTTYIDGSQDAQNTTSIPASIYSGTAPLRINTHFDADENFVGIIDEVRVIADGNSADWEATEFNNQDSPSTFYSVSDEQGSVPPTITNQPIITIMT